MERSDIMAISCSDFISAVPVSKTFFYKTLVHEVDVDKVYKLFTSKEHTTREKKTILYKSKNLNEDQKNTIWSAYMRDDFLDLPEDSEIDLEDTQ